MKHSHKLGILLVVASLVWLAVLASPDSDLHIVACSVGQGDAFLIQKGSTQIIVDGGPNNKILDCLSKHMPFWDREIELVVLTHPQADHLTGLIEIFRRYEVDTYLAPEVDNSTLGYKALKNAVGGSGASTIKPLPGQKIRLGLIYLDVLWPDKNTKSKDLNDYSVVFNLNYINFKALFTGDISPKISNNIANKTNYLKVPHHGSKNGLTQELLNIASPKLAVISVGKDNRFGHPHKEIIDMLEKNNVKVLRTDQVGDAEVISDGKVFWVVQ